MKAWLVPAAIAGLCLTVRLWPSYVPDALAFAACVLVFVPYALDRYFDWFEFYSRPAAALCFLVVAVLALLKGLEEGQLGYYVCALFIVVTAAFVVWQDEIAYGHWRGIPNRNLLFVVFMTFLGVAGAIEPWPWEPLNVLVPLVAVATCIAFLFDHDSGRYWCALFFSLGAVGYGLMVPNDPARLQGCLFSITLAVAALRGLFQAPKREVVEADEE